MIDEEQVISIAKKVLDEEHLLGFIKIFEKEHNLFRGSHDKIGLPENLVVPEKVITQIIQKGLPPGQLTGDFIQYDAEIEEWKRIAALNQGSIPFVDASGFLTEDNAKLFWDEVNARLGIGISVPIQSLHVYKAVATNVIQISANTRPWLLWDCLTGNYGFSMGFDADDKKFQLNYWETNAAVAHAQMMTFDGDNERIGIFENSPTYPFDVNGAVRFDDLYLNDTNASHVALIHWNENEASANRTLNFTLSGGDRTFALHGDLTVEGASLIDQDLTTDAAPTFASGVTIGNLILADGSITDSSGAIDFGDENLSTDGYIKIGAQNELRFYDNGKYVGFEAPALDADQIWVLPSADGNPNNVLATDGSGNLIWLVGGGGGATTFLELTDSPANYTGAENKIVKVNAIPDALVFGANISDLEDVDSIGGQAGKYAKVKAGDAGIEWAVGTGNGGAIDYLDNFDDESLHWTWRTHNVTAQKTITEAGGVLTIAIAGGTEGNWWTGVNTAPKVITGIRAFPCEVICKLNSYTVPGETNAGLHVSYNALGTTANHSINYVRQDTGLVAAKIGTVLDSNLITTLPIWLRIRILSFPTGAMGSRLIFSYSINGSDWTDQYTYDLFDYDIRSCGLIVKNWGAKNAIAAPFDFFKVVPSLGADG